MNRFQASTVLLLIGSFLSLTACETNAVEPGDPTTQPNPDPVESGKTGYVIGRVTDPQGKPLPRATIFTDNTVFKGRGAEVNTASDGTYQIQLVKDLGQWVAKGYILKSYNGKVYKINLDPENSDSFTDGEKAVRDFQWKLTGHVPDLSLDLYYGGTVEMLRDLNAEGLRDNENIEFTFMPVGPLIDGSTGKTMKRRAAKRYDSYIKDVPIGRYTVTAVYTPTGEALRVGDAWADEIEYANSVTVDFIGRESAAYTNMLRIRFTNR